MLMEEGQDVYNKIIEHFGVGILDENKNINRKKLGEIVFNDNDKLEVLNSIIHPGVREYIEDKINNKTSDEKIIIESAILVEAGYEDICDEIWYVFADEKVRRERLKKSRGYTDDKIDSIMKNQASDLEFCKNADKIIDNSKSVEDTISQIKKICDFKHHK